MNTNFIGFKSEVQKKFRIWLKFIIVLVRKLISRWNLNLYQIISETTIKSSIYWCWTDLFDIPVQMCPFLEDKSFFFVELIKCNKKKEKNERTALLHISIQFKSASSQSYCCFLSFCCVHLFYRRMLFKRNDKIFGISVQDCMNTQRKDHVCFL